MIEDTLAELEAGLKALKTSTPAKKAALKRKLAAVKRELTRLRKADAARSEKADELTKLIAQVAPNADPRVLRTIDAICRELAAIGI